MILPAVPKAFAATIKRMMTNAISSETAMRVRDLRLQFFQVQRTAFAVNASFARARLDFERWLAHGITAAHMATVVTGSMPVTIRMPPNRSPDTVMWSPIASMRDTSSK